jgi:hypothetical protein
VSARPEQDEQDEQAVRFLVILLILSVSLGTSHSAALAELAVSSDAARNDPHAFAHRNLPQQITKNK